MIRILLFTSLTLLGLSGCASDQSATKPEAAAETAPKADPQAKNSDESEVKKSIFESRTKEDVEKLNHVDKSLYEVSGAAQPGED